MRSSKKDVERTPKVFIRSKPPIWIVVIACSMFLSTIPNSDAVAYSNNYNTNEMGNEPIVGMGANDLVQESSLLDNPIIHSDYPQTKCINNLIGGDPPVRRPAPPVPVPNDRNIDCRCEERIVELSVQYVGLLPSVMVDAYEDPGYVGLIVHYPAVVPYQTFLVDGTILPTGQLKASTYLVANAAAEDKVKTDCATQILGNTIGSFRVVGFRDKFGNSCSVDTHQDDADEDKSLGLASHSASMRVVPNPTNGIFKTTFTGLDPAHSLQISVFDTQGRMVLNSTNNTSGGSTDLDISQFPQGTYIIKAESGEDLMIERLIKY